MLGSLCLFAQSASRTPSPAPAPHWRVGTGQPASSPLVYAPDPQYTEEARKANIKGTVALWITVGPDGCAHEIKLARKLGYGLDETAVEALRRWKFRPAIRDGKPASTRITVELNFDPLWSPSRPLTGKLCGEQ